jgi:hypothetical protein
MTTELGWALLAILIIAGWIGVGFAREQLERRNRMRLREMLHQERMAALDKGLVLPETDVDDLLLQSFDASQVRGSPLPEGLSERALRRTVLGIGLVLLFGGVGWYLGVSAVPSTRETLGMPEMASLGAIPAMVGLGLLIFWLALVRER